MLAEPTRKRKRQDENEEGGSEDAVNEDAPSERHRMRYHNASQGMQAADELPQFVRGEKQYMFDHKGQKYLDTINSTQSVGHCHPVVVAAGATQMAELNTNSRFLNDRVVTYAQKLTATLPEKLSVCFFVNSRSEANSLALLMAEVVSGRSQCISLSGCYHGHLKDLRALRDEGKSPSSSCIAPTPDIYRGPYRDPETAGRRYAEEVQKIIEHQKTLNGGVAAFIHESVMCNAGVIFFPKGFLQTTYKSVRDAGGLCIADEGECGFGRTGEKFWSFELQGVCPDIVTLGKSVGNGHPVSGVVTSKDIADKFALSCEYFNTFGGNPVSMAIAESVLTVIEEENLQEHARQVGDFLIEQLMLLRDKYTCVGDVRGKGLCTGIDFVTDLETRDPDPAKAKEVKLCLLEDYKILCTLDDAHGNVIRLTPPMCFTVDNARDLVSALDAILLQFSHSPTGQPVTD